MKRERKRVWFQSIKKQYHCIVCKTNDFRVLDFHHRDSSTKMYRIAHMIYRASQAKILAEIQKCDCLCSNCHRILHYEEKRNLPLGQKNPHSGSKKNLNNIQLDV